MLLKDISESRPISMKLISTRDPSTGGWRDEVLVKICDSNRYQTYSVLPLTLPEIWAIWGNEGITPSDVAVYYVDDQEPSRCVFGDLVVQCGSLELWMSIETYAEHEGKRITYFMPPNDSGNHYGVIKDRRYFKLP